MMAKYQYDAYGNRSVISSTYTQAFGFSTKPYDAESGFAYFGYRYYSPVLGRWISRSSNDAQSSAGAYSYLANNAANRPAQVTRDAGATGRTASTPRPGGRGLGGGASGAVSGGGWSGCGDDTGAVRPPDYMRPPPASDDSRPCQEPRKKEDCPGYCGSLGGCTQCCFRVPDCDDACQDRCVYTCHQVVWPTYPV